jgi:hypothetical protein
MHLAWAGFIGRQGKRRISQGTRSQHLIAIVCHLPIRTGKRLLEPGIGRWPSNHEMPITTDIDAGEQLSEMDVKITGQRARHMTLKQQHEACASDPKRDEDGDHAAGHQTKP